MDRPRTRTTLRFSLPKLKGIPGLKSPPGWGLPRYGARSRTRLLQTPDAWWLRRYPDGSPPEWAIFITLLRMGLKRNTDFIFRTVLGGIQVEFFFPVHNVALLIRQQSGASAAQRPSEPIASAQLAALGIKAIYVDEHDILADPRRAVREALNI